MTSKLTRDIIQREIADFFAWVVEIHTELGGPNTVEEAQNQLTDRVLACVPEVDSEPVAWTWHHLKQWHVTNDEERARDLAWDGVKVDPLYRHVQPAPERDRVRCEHAVWSQDTFGNVGPVGPLKHLSKEALEAAAEPDDLSEWADMQFLLWDAQRRAGITDEQITQAMIEKLAVNKQREWPEPKDGEPRLHIKELPAPVVPDDVLCDFYEVNNWPDLVRELVKHVEQLQDSARRNVKPWEDTFPETLLPAYIDRVKQSDDACRAAMLQAGNSPVIPGAEQRIADAVELLKQAATAMLADNSGPDGPLVGRLKFPVIPDGSFSDLEDARLAIEARRKELHGGFYNPAGQVNCENPVANEKEDDHERP